MQYRLYKYKVNKGQTQKNMYCVSYMNLRSNTNTTRFSDFSCRSTNKNKEMTAQKKVKSRGVVCY